MNIAKSNQIRNVITTTKQAHGNLKYLNKYKKVPSNNHAVRKCFLSFSSQPDLYDESNLLKFNTLHELQSNASIAFADNPLFGTYTEKEEKEPYFDYMTYSEFGAKVDTCRALLHDLGMSMFLLM